MSKNITLKNVMLRYESIFEPKALTSPEGKAGKPTFSATFVLDKEKHKDIIALVEKQTERTALDKFGKKVSLKNVPIRDGSEKEKPGFGDEVVFIGAKNETRPGVVDGGMVPLVGTEGKIHWGCIVNAVISLYAWSHPTGGKGVSASLGAVQFVKEGPVRYGADAIDPNEVFETLPASQTAVDVDKF